MAKRVPNAERRSRTREALLRAGRKTFASRGFADSSLDAIVAEAGVTRGALYHQFRDKAELFEAVLDRVEGDLAAELMREAAGLSDPADLLKHSIQAFLALCRRPDVHQIALLDAPSVVGWAKWREIDARHGFGLLRGILAEAARQERIESHRVDALSHLFLGAATEAALALAQTPDDDDARAGMIESLEWMVDRMLGSPPDSPR